MNIDGMDTIQLCCVVRERLERAAKTEYLEIPLDILARIEDDVLVGADQVQAAGTGCACKA